MHDGLAVVLRCLFDGVTHVLSEVETGTHGDQKARQPLTKEA